MFFACVGGDKPRKLSKEEQDILAQVIMHQCSLRIKSKVWHKNYIDLRKEAAGRAWEAFGHPATLDKIRNAEPKLDNEGMKKMAHAIVRNTICSYFRDVIYKKQTENKRMVKKHGKLYSVIFDFFCKKRMKQLKGVWEQVRSVLPQTEYGDFLSVYSETKCNKQHNIRMADEISLEGDVPDSEKDEKNEIVTAHREVREAICAKQVYDFLIKNFKHDEIAIFKKLFEMTQHNTKGDKPKMTQKQIAKSFGCQESKVSNIKNGEIIPKLYKFLETKFDVYDDADFVKKIITIALNDF